MPPIPTPSATADAHEWDEAARKRVIEAMFDPRARRALLDGLTAPDLRERRMWWTMALAMVRKPGGDGDGGSGSVKITLNNVPAPPHEDGPVQRIETPAIDATAMALSREPSG